MSENITISEEKKYPDMDWIIKWTKRVSTFALMLSFAPFGTRPFLLFFSTALFASMFFMPDLRDWLKKPEKDEPELLDTFLLVIRGISTALFAAVAYSTIFFDSRRWMENGHLINAIILYLVVFVIFDTIFDAANTFKTQIGVESWLKQASSGLFNALIVVWLIYSGADYYMSADKFKQLHLQMPKTMYVYTSDRAGDSFKNTRASEVKDNAVIESLFTILAKSDFESMNKLDNIRYDIAKNSHRNYRVHLPGDEGRSIQYSSGGHNLNSGFVMYIDIVEDNYVIIRSAKASTDRDTGIFNFLKNEQTDYVARLDQNNMKRVTDILKGQIK